MSVWKRRKKVAVRLIEVVLTDRISTSNAAFEEKSAGGFRIVGERRIRHIFRVVTSFPNRKVSARRIARYPQAPNQTPEPTRWCGALFVSGFSAHHRRCFESFESTLERVAHL